MPPGPPALPPPRPGGPAARVVPAPPLRGRGDRERAGGAVPGEPARDLAPPQGARARGTDRPQPRGSVAAEPAAGRPPRRGSGVGAVAQADVGGPDGPTRSAPAPERRAKMSDSTP